MLYEKSCTQNGYLVFQKRIVNLFKYHTLSSSNNNTRKMKIDNEEKMKGAGQDTEKSRIAFVRTFSISIHISK